MEDNSSLSLKTTLVIVFGITGLAFVLYQLATFINRPIPPKIFEPVPQELFLYVPPLIGTMPNTDTGTCFLISTGDFSRDENTPELKPYVSTIQIVDADQPWPPRWYACTPLYSDEMFHNDTLQGLYRFDLMFDAKVEAGHLSFFKILSRQPKGVGQLIAPDLAAYILLDKNLEPFDSISSTTKKRNVYYHDFRINERGEKIIDLRKDTYLDLRDYSGEQKDSAVHCNIDYIQILDANDSILFSWNPLEHIHPDIFEYKETLREKPVGGNNNPLVEWTRLTSALWDYDENLLFSMRKIGIGKISRLDGRVIWAIYHTDIPYIAGKDTLEWYSPHDFNYLYDTETTATYSVYSNGKKGVKYAGGVVFEQNKKTHEIKLVKHVTPQSKYVAKGHGNLDYKKDGSYVMSYGHLFDTDNPENFRDDMQYGKNDSVYGIYQTPKGNPIYKAHRLENFPRPPRPEIVLKNGLLEAKGDMTDWTWYKLSDPDKTTVTSAGTGKSITPEKGITYCVEGKYGIGFSVSRCYTFDGNR